MSKARRRVFAGLFALGVLLAVAFGALLAAYDIWGGVPRSAWPFARVLFGAALAAVCARAIVRAAVVLAALGAFAGAALWLHYSSRWDTSRLVCAPALVASTRAERDAALREGLGPLFPVIDPHHSCIQLERERRALDASGTCPTFVMDDVPCACGRQRWEPGRTPKCASGPTACQYRGDRGEALGCADHGSAFILEEARDAERARNARRPGTR